MSKPTLDRAKLAKLLNATRSDDVNAVAMAMRTANKMLDASAASWENIIPNAKIKTVVGPHAPSFVEPIEYTLIEAIEIVLKSRDERRREFAGIMQLAHRNGDTLHVNGIRMIHRYAREERRR